MALQHFNSGEFLRHYWQQQALLIRQGLPDFDCPVDGDDLAGLACEHSVDSRLVLGDQAQWQLRRGPFQGSDFAALPARDWTLLVQGVDQWIPDVAELCRHFRFVPRWRLEDIMVSYAVDGGNVGPHFDQYDVFLLQGKGRRRWRLGPHCAADTPCQPHPDLKLLANFHSQSEYLLEAGDILYVPPGVAHWGSAEGDDCITLSVGFRAPSRSELLADFADHYASLSDDGQRYRDVGLASGVHPARISAEALAAAKAQLLACLDDDRVLLPWFGELMTRRERAEEQDQVLDASGFQAALLRGELQLSLGARLAFADNQLFADGETIEFERAQLPAIERLCQLEGGATIDPQALSSEVLYRLYCVGAVELLS